MDKRIVFKNLDGSCGIFVPSPDCKKDLESLAVQVVPEGLEWRIVSVEEIPSDRHFRAAWTDDKSTQTVDVDIKKAIEVQKDYIRDARRPLLEDLDVRELRGEDVEAEKQILRDMPSLCDGVENLNELKKIMP